MPDRSSSRPAAAAAVGPAARPGLALLITLAAVGPFAMNLPLPAMPAMARGLEVSYGTIQLVLTLFLASVAASQLILGPLSDRFGRRPVMIAGLGLFTLGGLVCAAAPSAELLVTGRVIQAAGGCAGLVLGRAIVRDLYGRERSASMIGYITMAMVVAPMAAPLVGGFLVEWSGWRSMFLLLSAVGLAVAAVALWFLGETHAGRGESGRVGFLGGAASLLRIPAFQGYCVITAFASGMFFGFIGGAPYVVVELMQRPASEYGLWFMISALGYMSGNFLSGRFAERLGPGRMIVAGTLAGFLGLAAFWLFLDVLEPAAIFGPMCLIALSNGLVLPSATASAVSVRPELAGTASGLCGSLQLGVGALMSWLVGALVEASTLPMILVMTACALVSLVGLAQVRRAGGQASD